ncbi:nephrin-like [Glandiceps talaboti]
MDFSITHRCNIIRTWLLISILSGFQCLGQLTVTVNNVETATEGDASTTISCTYSGFAETPITIIITWEKTDLDTGQKEFLIQQFDGFPDSIGRYSVEGQATLRITGPVTIEDRGRYTCKITIIGSLTSGTEQAGVELVIHSPVQDLIMGVEGQIDLLGENDMVTMIEGRPITIICWAKQANPAADVLWYLGNEQIISGVGGFTVESNTEEVDQPGDNRLNTVSKLTFSPIYNQHQNHVLMCTAQNEVMTRERTLSVYPRILVPPSQHYVVGYDNGAAVPVIENQVFTISCRAEDSYPLTQLIWYLNGELIETGITTNNLPSSDGRVSVMSTWTYMASRAKGDDGATIQCEASGEPLSSSNTVFVTLEILYPPTDIQIIGDNTDFKAGEQASGVLCSSSGGKPDARVSWWKDNQEKVSEVLNSNRLEVEMTAEDNGQSYTCMSSNDANIGNPLQRNSAPLNVLCKYTTL